MKSVKVGGKTYITNDKNITVAIYDKTGFCEYYLNILPPKIKKVLCGHLDTCSGDWCARKAESCICPPERYIGMGWPRELDE